MAFRWITCCYSYAARPRKEREIERYIAEVSETTSANYHRWLKAEEIGQRYGVAQHDLNTITGWLKSHGFSFDKVYPTAW
jgi:subtilase family serine protease